MLCVITQSFEQDTQITIIHISDYIRYSELNKISSELQEAQIGDIVVVAGKMPSWYALGIVSELRGYPQVQAIGIYRPPAKKVLIVWSSHKRYPIGSWIQLSKKLTYLCEHGELP